MADNPVIRTFGGTDRGLMRTRNEDAFLVDDNVRVYAVADGLGGLPEGALASFLAIEELKRYCKDAAGRPLELREVFDGINRKVHAAGMKIGGDIGIGTTLTVVQTNGRKLEIGHVGDSGAYALQRNGKWRKLTIDHTMAQEMRDRLPPGEDTYIPEYYTHTLTRCIGQRGPIDVDVYRHEIQPGERVLLYSDGVTKTMNEDELVDEAFRTDDPESFVARIIDTANERGGPDNVTAVALFFD